jgi:hypothetical protein
MKINEAPSDQKENKIPIADQHSLEPPKTEKSRIKLKSIFTA